MVTGPPLIDDLANQQIQSIFERPKQQNTPALPLSGEINYAFARSRTQLFFGIRLEDILRLDAPIGLGIRQELPDKSIIAASFLLTPTDLKFWADPYVENEDRIKTGLSFRGVRLRWGRILKTGLELTATYRRYQYDDEKSGNWLISQGRLNPNDKPSLSRDGEVLRLQALYRIEVKQQHRFEPALRYVDNRHDGEAIANNGVSFQLTYLYLSPKILLDFNLGFGQRKAQGVHPVYGTTLETDRLGGAVSIFYPVKRYESSALSLVLIGEYFREDVNVDFFDTRIGMILFGIAWRHRR